LSTLSGLAVNPDLYGARLPYSPLKDLAPVLLAATVPSVVVVHPPMPVKAMAELGTYLKANPGKVSDASAGRP
jgi:tripartite-type tricarboxylate transporter receptor subunit TctC